MCCSAKIFHLSIEVKEKKRIISTYPEKNYNENSHIFIELIIEIVNIYLS